MVIEENPAALSWVHTLSRIARFTRKQTTLFVEINQAHESNNLSRDRTKREMTAAKRHNFPEDHMSL